MDNKTYALKAIEALKNEYPQSECSLNYTEPLQLLIATRLAAQCTDARVNLVTPHLFSKFKSAQDFANANTSEIEEIIHSCGFYRVKSTDIVNMCKMIVSNYGGIVPNTMEDLLTLPGVGRKTANLVLGDIFKKPAIVVDTHCIRITHRLGFHSSKDAFKIEKILKEILPENESNDFCHRLVLHGRAVCTARNPKCEICCMNGFCKKCI